MTMTFVWLLEFETNNTLSLLQILLCYFCPIKIVCYITVEKINFYKKTESKARFLTISYRNRTANKFIEQKVWAIS